MASLVGVPSERAPRSPGSPAYCGCLPPVFVPPFFPVIPFPSRGHSSLFQSLHTTTTHKQIPIPHPQITGRCFPQCFLSGRASLPRLSRGLFSLLLRSGSFDPAPAPKACIPWVPDISCPSHSLPSGRNPPLCSLPPVRNAIRLCSLRRLSSVAECCLLAPSGLLYCALHGTASALSPSAVLLPVPMSAV
jgi:hypothetical protein